MEKIYLIGGGGHCNACIDVLEATGRFAVEAIFDPAPGPATGLEKYDWLGSETQIEKYLDRTRQALITLGALNNLSKREELFSRLKAQGLQFPLIVSPHAYLSPQATLGAGTIVMHRAVVNSGVRGGVNLIINTAAVIEHDCMVGDHSQIASGAIVGGGCRIGSRVLVGGGAVIKNGIAIGDDVTIGAGAVVVKDIASPGVYIGNPARRRDE